jgi:hypothetical protein
VTSVYFRLTRDGPARRTVKSCPRLQAPGLVPGLIAVPACTDGEDRLRGASSHRFGPREPEAARRVGGQGIEKQS